MGQQLTEPAGVQLCAPQVAIMHRIRTADLRVRASGVQQGSWHEQQRTDLQDPDNGSLGGGGRRGRPGRLRAAGRDLDHRQHRQREHQLDLVRFFLETGCHLVDPSVVGQLDRFDLRQLDLDRDVLRQLDLDRDVLVQHRVLRQRRPVQRREQRVMTAALRARADAGLPTAGWWDWSCQVRLVVTDAEVLARAAGELAALMSQVERAASRFRPDSELSLANAHAGRPVPVSRLLIRLLDAALEQAGESHGMLDPTLGRELVRLGYDRDIALLGGDVWSSDAARPADRASWRDVRLDRSTGLLTVPAGVALDLGASAKALTADWAAAELAQRHGCSVLVEIGGDLAVAGPKDDWQITVAERAGGPSQQITLAGGGLATSTSTLRRWRSAGRQLHHILDPVTGQPADGPWRTVTVAADSALRANTCSTVAIVLGVAATGWLTGRRVAARLIGSSGELARVGGWPEQPSC
jgi:thiamine biosynthesis lipoprotein